MSLARRRIWSVLGMVCLTAIGCTRSEPPAPEVSEPYVPVVWPPDLGSIEVPLEENLLRKNYYIVFDGSGSMSGEKIRAAKQALETFVAEIPDDSHVGLFVFDDAIQSERAPLGSSRQTILGQIGNVVAGGGTPLTSSIGVAYHKLLEKGHRQLGYGEYTIVVVTDGRANDASALQDAINGILRESPVVIYTIGFKIGARHTLNQPGRTIYRAANDLDELTAALQDVLAEAEDFTVLDFE